MRLSLLYLDLLEVLWGPRGGVVSFALAWADASVSLAAVCVLQAPLDEKRGQEIRERPVIFALLKVLDHALCIFGPSYVCFDLPNCGLALRTAAVARVLVPACATLDVRAGKG